MSEKSNPIMEIRCGTCRRCTSGLPSYPPFFMYCNKKENSVSVFEFCENWMPNKGSVVNQIFRFNYNKNKGE